MLGKRENEIMTAVYELCDGTESCLVSPAEILAVLPQKRKIGYERLDEVLNDLKSDGYFDLIASERKGERMYVINLKESGFSFKRERLQRRRDITFKIFLALIGATATFVFGLILRAIFGQN